MTKYAFVEDFGDINFYIAEILWDDGCNFLIRDRFGNPYLTSEILVRVSGSFEKLSKLNGSVQELIQQRRVAVQTAQKQVMEAEKKVTEIAGNHALKIRKEIRKFIGGEAADARKVKK